MGLSYAGVQDGDGESLTGKRRGDDVSCLPDERSQRGLGAAVNGLILPPGAVLLNSDLIQGLNRYTLNLSQLLHLGLVQLAKDLLQKSRGFQITCPSLQALLLHLLNGQAFGYYGVAHFIPLSLPGG